MIRIEDTVDVRMPADEAFAYLTDFRNLPQWDPGIAAVTLTSGAEVREDARFDVTALFFGRRVPMRYRVSKYDTNARHAVLAGESDTVFATDRITVTEATGGARVLWQAEFVLRGPFGLLERVSRPVFERYAKKALDGLRRKLG
jgi:dehydrogenase/reductase SDR family member 12